jgi:ribosomal protein L11 methyltransferase
VSTAAASQATKPLAAKRFSWRKLSAAKWSDSWLERLTYLGPTRAMVIEFPGARTVRVEAHGLTQKEADELVKMFGGRVTEAKWLTAVDTPERAPIRVRGRLLVVSTAKELSPQEKLPVIVVPAGMAFGTGEHATTATCLRMIADVATKLRRTEWDALDLGTGSGILAIAAARLGASSVLATDFDPHAVRTAKENVKVNKAKVRVVRSDVRQWEPDRTWPVVMANLFSGLLVEVAPKIAKAIAAGGTLVFSGVLREQEAEVLAAFAKQKLQLERVVRKGKWIAGTLTKPLGGRKSRPQAA